MSCSKCEALDAKVNPNLPHVVRQCPECGASYKARNPGKHGIGFKINKGDKVVFPGSFLQISANPLKGNGNLSRHGIAWFAELVFGVKLPQPVTEETVKKLLEDSQEVSEAFFKDAPELSAIDLTAEEGTTEAFTILQKSPQSIAWWGFMSASGYAFARSALESGDAYSAAWHIISAERFKSMAVFRRDFEEVVHMGHSAGRLIQLLRTWEANKENGTEGFWQQTLQENSYAFSQLFAAPVTFIAGAAYVGGMQIDRKDARYLDFLLSGGNSNQAVLVEIKTPTEKLLGTQYRKNVYPPSKDLSGAVVQVNDYCDILRRDITGLTKHAGIELNVFNPRRIVLIGNYAKELTDARMKSSFELFRSSLAGIEIVTFDEFFKKVGLLANIFNLVHSSTETTTVPTV